MKRFLFLPLLFLLGLFLPAPAQAQFSRILSIDLLNNDNSVAQSFQSNFSLKVGSGCTWSVTGTVAAFSCSGGGGSPASPTNSLQVNGGGGSFGSIPTITANNMNCDGLGDACYLFMTTPMGYSGNLIAGTSVDAPMGNYFDIFQGTDGGLYMDSFDGTHNASFSISGTTGNSFWFSNAGLGAAGIKIENSVRNVSFGRFQFDSTYLQALVTATNFSAGAGWGNTVVVTAGGYDNLFHVNFAAGGTGITANPTFTFTYANGDMSSGGATTYYVCTQTGGDDVLADTVTTTRNQTNEIFTWRGTPTTGKNYEITCFGAS